MEDNEYLTHLSIVGKWSPEMSRKYVPVQTETLKIIAGNKESDKVRKSSGSNEEEFIRAAAVCDLKSLLNLKSKVVVDIQNSKGQTALIAACLGGHVSAVRFLLAKDALTEIFDHTGNSALHHACLKDDLTILKVLLEKVHPDYKNEDGKSILHLAVKFEKYKTIDFLLHCSNNIPININDQDMDGNTAVHLAILNRNIKLLEKLLTTEIDISLYNKDGLNPVNMSVARDDLECLKILLGTKYGMKVFENASRSNESNFQMAVRSKFNDIVDFLLNMKENCIVTTEIDEKYGYTCLHWATLQMNNNLIDKILNKNQKLINIKDMYNLTVLEHVVNLYEKSRCNRNQNTLIDIAIILISHDADIDLVENRYGLRKTLKDILIKKT